MAPPLIWPSIHTRKSILLTLKTKTAVWKVKNGLEATSHQKLATDGASPSGLLLSDGLQQSYHELCPTRTSWHNSPPYTCTGRGGGSGNWELHVNQLNSAGILYNYLCILYITSNSSSFYTFNVKFGWILKL